MGLRLLLLRISIDQLNALVNFELALLRYDGQFLVGVNRPAEQSVLVLGLSLEADKTLGRRFERNAVVWTGRDGVPELVLLE